MQPAFSSTRQAGTFALLLLVLLLLPAWMGKSWLPPRENIYSSMWWATGAYPYIDQQIFVEKGDIDIAFVGPSHLWQGIDPVYVQEKLSEKLGRPAVVRSICWGGTGYDALYFITQDLLQNRKVHLLVYYDAYNEQDQPSLQAPHWFRFGDNAEALSGLPFPIKASYYLAAIIGMPRTLLGLVRSNLPAPLLPQEKNYWENLVNAENITVRLGALTSRMGFGATLQSTHRPFEAYAPEVAGKSSEVAIYSPDTKAMFEFTDSAFPSWQLHFAQKFAGLADTYGCKFVLLHIPVPAERKSMTISERKFWPEALHADVAMVGIPPAKLFDGMTEEQVQKLYEDPGHFNKNGQEYFTSIITPSLLQIYDAPASR